MKNMCHNGSLCANVSSVYSSLLGYLPPCTPPVQATGTYITHPRAARRRRAWVWIPKNGFQIPNLPITDLEQIIFSKL